MDGRTTVVHFFRRPGVAVNTLQTKLEQLGIQIEDIQTEYCFNVELEDALNETEIQKLVWLLSETFEPENFSDKSFLEQERKGENYSTIVEVGPRLSFTTAWSTNAVNICNNCGISKVKRMERSTRFLIITKQPFDSQKGKFLEEVHDRMTEMEYSQPLNSFKLTVQPQPVQVIPILEKGRAALDEINKELGLAFDEQDIQLYLKMFQDMGRNPTNVELFDLSQSNSEHSRHWFFKGKMIIDGKEMPESLMQIVQSTLTSPNNSILAFCDDSSALQGFTVKTITPSNPTTSSPFQAQDLLYHITFTAETHNFPTGVAPKPGAETGTGGRIRDVHAVGRGGLVIAGTAAYCVGNLQIPGYDLPWEDKSFQYPSNIARPLKIEVEASNGASDYGNKFGEPIIQGFTRSFGLKLPNDERREWIKPIMFTGGVGQLDDRHKKKESPQKEMLVVKIGGPAYRIGMGGGSASSMAQGENKEGLDFNAVQRGDAEMEQKLNRVIKACVELGDRNPIVSIHDQGAGGNANVLKEIVEPEGAKFEIRNIVVADNTLSVLEIWGAEYQENDAILLKKADKELFETICKREHLLYAFVGEVTGDGMVVLHDSWDDSTPVNMELSKVLGKMPPKTFESTTIPKKLQPLSLPKDITIKSALDRVLRLVSVGSKLFLTNKVDRSVSGLIAQQQCVGPVQLPLSDVAVVAQSYFGVTGAAISIGEQPIKGLVNNAAMGRMTVGESITNIMWANITDLKHIKASGNWMWAAKLPGEGAAMYDTANSMRNIMLQLGIAIDGGKDSLSMATFLKQSGHAEVVKAPGTLVISNYVTVKDVTKTITPDIKYPGNSKLYFIDLASSKTRMGGSALAQTYNQIGDVSPDVDDVELLKKTFHAIQTLIENRLITAGHDRSDGGLIVTLLEMAFAGNCGLKIQLKDMPTSALMEYLFNEELGVVIEVKGSHEAEVTKVLSNANIPYLEIAQTTVEQRISITAGTTSVLNESMTQLRDIWNETSYKLELLQANPICVEQERASLKSRKGLHLHLSFKPEPTSSLLLSAEKKPKVAILREEGSNGDREMAAAFYAAGFEVWDVMMSDLLDHRQTLKQFDGIVFVGGFSYADVMDSGKGWSGAIRFNKDILAQFEEFYERKNTFSLGVCNGCQLMALLGWIPMKGLSMSDQPRFIHNKSGRFESRFAAVKIMKSPSVLLKGMEDSILGIWVAHGEGHLHFPNKSILTQVRDQNLAPVRYVDDEGSITEAYPHNPNGSVEGIAALCTQDGRHLAIMPHPERVAFGWQWGYMPTEWKSSLQASPWLKMFQNAREFCEGNKR